MKLDLSQLNKQQRKAVIFKDDALMVNAAAGSGKTRVLTYRIAYLLKRGYRPSRIMATTFTTKAAEEMRERLEPIVGETKADRLRIGTFHSLSLRILKDLSEHNGKYEHPRTLMPGARFMTMLGIINRYKYGKQPWEHRFSTKDIIGILNQISYWKNEGLRVKDVEEQLKKEKIKLVNEKTEIEPEWSFTLEGTWLQAYKDYEEENKKSNRIDFDDMLLKTFHRLQFKKNKKFLDRLRNKIDHILVDESQDLNKIQFLLVKLFAGKNRRITMVGDDYQCQPTNTMVTLEGGKQVPIQELKVGQKLVTYNKREARFAGLKTQGNKIIGVQKRKYNGTIFIVKTNNNITRATPEHDWFVRFNSKSTNTCVVYMMELEGKFRIGWCQLFNSQGASHLLQRMRLEKADNIWILKVCKNRRKASLWESIISSKFGLPLIMFQPRDNCHYDRKGIDFIFNQLGSLHRNAINCLEYFDKKIDLPFYSKGMNISRGGSRIFKISTSNIIPELMSVPVFKGKKGVTWEPIKIRKENYCGMVYSIAVENSHTYISDNIATHNCLYGFRGASVNEIIDFGKFYDMEIIKLEQNYRSTKHIVEYGNKLIKHNKVQMWKNLFTENEQGVPAHVSVSENVDEEAQKILEKVQELIYSGYELNDVAILYRTNAQSRAIVDEFIINHVPHKVYSREGFYDRKEVKDMLAYLKIVCDPHSTNADDYRRIINRPSRFLGKKFIDDVENLMFDEDYESYWLALQSSWKIDLGQRQRTTVQKFIDQLSRMAKKCETTEMTSRETLEMIIEETGYLKWMNKKDEESGENEPDNDNEMNLDSLLVGADRFSSPTDFLMFVESQEFEKNEEEDAIHVMTIHKSKGMEFPFVFIIGLCTPVMPHYKSNNPEEERRIAYVAITRAKEELYLSTINGKFNRMNARPSPFIDEMGAKFPSWYSGQVIGVDKALKSSSKPMVTKYDVRGNIVSIKEIKKIDSVMYAIADKHGLIDERTGELVENENPLDTES